MWTEHNSGRNNFQAGLLGYGKKQNLPLVWTSQVMENNVATECKVMFDPLTLQAQNKNQIIYKKIIFQAPFTVLLTSKGKLFHFEKGKSGSTYLKRGSPSSQ